MLDHEGTEACVSYKSLAWNAPSVRWFLTCVRSIAIDHLYVQIKTSRRTAISLCQS